MSKSKRIRSPSSSGSRDTPDKRQKVELKQEPIEIKDELVEDVIPLALMPDLRTYRDNGGDVQSTFAWDTRDRILALRTETRPDATESVFLASRTILERESSVFKDAMVFPRQEQFEGHPVLIVQDHPADMQIFLEALHDHREFFARDWKNSYVVSALLRLSTKYKVSLLQKQMETVILEDWYSTELHDYHVDPWTADNRRTDIISLSLAKECDLRIVLPDLLYRTAVAWSLSDIIAAPLRSRDLDEEEDKLWFFDEDLRFRTIKVHAAMGRWLLEIVQILLGQTRECKNRGCGTAISDWNDRRSNLGSDRSTTTQLDKAADVLNKAFYDYEKLCTNCEAKAKPKIKAFMKKAWDNLPETAGLPRWSVLKSSRSESAAPGS